MSFFLDDDVPEPKPCFQCKKMPDVASGENDDDDNPNGRIIMRVACCGVKFTSDNTDGPNYGFLHRWNKRQTEAYTEATQPKLLE